MFEELNRLHWLGNPAIDWLIAAIAALLGFLLVRAAVSTARSYLHKADDNLPTAAARATHPLRTLLDHTRNRILLLLAFVIAARWLDFPEPVESTLGNLAFALIGLQFALWINALIALWLARPSTIDGRSRSNPVLAGVLKWVAQLIVWTTLLLAMLANAGINITAFVASLGIGGIAVALALQNLLGDLFSSISIGLDKPFEVGEFIGFGSEVGTVRRVGIKSTRIDSLSGEQIILSNTNLLGQIVHNYSRMRERRIAFGFRLPYGTTSAQVRLVVDGVREIIRTSESLRFDRGHQTTFGQYGLEFEFVYYVRSSDFALYRDEQQRVNLAILDLLATHKLDFSVPEHALRLRGDWPGAASMEQALRAAAPAADPDTH